MILDASKIRRILAVANDPREYLLTPPKGHDPDLWKPARIILVPFGPLVLWTNFTKDDAKCPACGGFGELEAYGKDGQYYDCECPKCDGAGEIESEKAGDDPDVWTDPDGNILDPVLGYPEDGKARPSEAWVREWIQAQQAAR